MSDSLEVKLGEVLLSEKELLIILVLDSSGSMSDQYERLREFTLAFIEKFPNTMIQIMQFGTIVQVVCALTKDQNILKESVTNLVFCGGSTNLHEAIKEVNSTLFRNLTESMNSFVLVLTDGEPTGANPGPQIKELLATKPQPHVMAIGVGRAHNLSQRLNQLFPNQDVFMLNDVATLNEKLKSLKKRESSKICPLVISFKAGDRKELQKVTDNLALVAVVRPEATLTKNVPRGTKITFMKNKFFTSAVVTLPKDLAPRHDGTLAEKLELPVTLQVQPNARFTGEFPERLFFEVQLIDGTRFPGDVVVDIAWFAKDFVTPYPMNILVWGPMGAGKSSFINSAISIFTSDPHPTKLLTALNLSSHVTQDYTGTSISRVLETNPGDVSSLIKKEVRLKLWDSWGVTDQTYTHLTILPFLEGRIQHEFMKSDCLVYSPGDERRRIHGIIFVLPIALALSKAELDLLQSHILYALRSKYKPVIVINHCKEVGDDSQVEECLRMIKKATGLSDPDHFVHENYSNETNRNPRTDLSTRAILLRTIENARLFVKLTGIQPSQDWNDRECDFNGSTPQVPKPIPNPPTPNPALSELEEFLGKYTQYRAAFIKLGYESNDELATLTDEQFKQLNVLPPHQKILEKKVEALKRK